MSLRLGREKTGKIKRDRRKVLSRLQRIERRYVCVSSTLCKAVVDSRVSSSRGDEAERMSG